MRVPRPTDEQVDILSVSTGRSRLWCRLQLEDEALERYLAHLEERIIMLEKGNLMATEINQFEDLKGETLTSVTGEKGDNEMVFTLTDGRQFLLLHFQDCCEDVRIEDICGDLRNLVGSPLTMAEEVTNDNEGPKPSYYSESYTWTFYKLATIKGYVTIRWLGESNGYYSEDVSFREGGKGQWD